MAPVTPPAGFALYVHWPFCLSKCPYCDFNSHVAGMVDQPRWRAALLRELDHAAALLPGRRLDSIFFGGGTPSLMPPATAAAVIERALAHWPGKNDIEITMEANPTSVEAGRLAEFRAAGVNRLSLGVQALDDAALRFLGRGHSSAEAIAALAAARRNFERFSFDLIYARPGQGVSDWRRELNGAVALAGGHLSVYQLTIEPGTAFHPRHQRREFVLPDGDLAADLYDATQDILERAGLPAYEVSNHAAAGQECRHNLVYWRSGEWVGIGPGAHGRIGRAAGRLATRRHRAPETWLAAVERDGHGDAETVLLSDEERQEETLMMGLRLVEGIDLAELARPLDPRRLAVLRASGDLAEDPGRLRATLQGRRRLNAVLGHLLA